LKRSRLRNGLVVFQFSLSVLLLSGTLIVRKQMAYVQNQDLGFQREHVVVLHTLGQIDRRLPVFKKALLNSPDVIAVSASSSVPGKGYLNVGFHVEGSHDSWPSTICIAADADFLNVMQIEMKEGRFFDEEILSDRRAVIFNANKARAIGAEDLYKQRIQIGSLGETPFHVIGIVGDFHYESFHEPVKPMGIVMLSEAIGWSEDYISVRIRSDDIQGALAPIKKVWEDFISNLPFTYNFLDNIYDDMYRSELRTSQIFSFFTLFTLFVACLGLLGLASFAAEQRKKEFGIRKVLGATTASIIILLSKEYQKLIVLANCIAWPIVYLIMKRWLQSFVYRTSMNVFIFLGAGFLVLAIAYLAVIYHSLKAASANPVEALKYE
jgi:putative ABC transport system permease protein